LSRKESAEAVRPSVLSLYCAEGLKSAQNNQLCCLLEISMLFAGNQQCCLLGTSFGAISRFAYCFRPARQEADKMLGIFKNSEGEPALISHFSFLISQSSNTKNKLVGLSALKLYLEFVFKIKFKILVLIILNIILNTNSKYNFKRSDPRKKMSEATNNHPSE
jgi:hypothetical protein